ncbi:MAG: methyltransferase domain-containing protein [Verrucomicrobiota bacterium]|nr:methyltransferase domain-containing protein [Flavobacteriales bacterium]MDZ4814679.1 methyltransferase domain-containing protein [Verrucomicrobiota bacterium]
MIALKNYIPKRIKDAVKVLLGRAVVIPAIKNVNFPHLACPVCGKKNATFNELPMKCFSKFNDIQVDFNVFSSETMNLENYSCSHCGCSDRDRLMSLYLNEIIPAIKEAKIKVLEIAPSPPLSKYLKLWPQIILRTADLSMANVDDRIDITDMSLYDSNIFDIIICSHVLEHINDDRKAMSEIYRVLKNHGHALLMVPIDLSIQNTYEDDTIISEDMRWRHFGQNDHVRRYAKYDYVERLENVGFEIIQLGGDYFGFDAFNQYAIHRRSVLYVGIKKPHDSK